MNRPDVAWHTKEASAVARILGVEPPSGLSAEEAADRLERHGPNRLEERGGKRALRIFWEQFTETMVLLLVFAAGVSAFIGDLIDTAAILAIVVLNAVLGFIQEYRAEKSIEALQRLASPTVNVRRDGRIRELSSEAVVPGDVVLLSAGAVVPADVRLIEVHNLTTQEAVLTGESQSVTKSTKAMEDPKAPLGDRIGMAYMGTTVASGRGVAIVIATGMDTELGDVAGMVQAVEITETPLQRRLDRLAKVLASAALALVALIFILGLLRGEALELMFLTAVTIAVAAVPEGLPAVVTIALALGAQRMLDRNALIRKLPAVETLGSVTIICSDKTGTLTQNRMRVERIDGVSENGTQTFDLRGDDTEVGREDDRLGEAVSLVLMTAALCNDAEPGGAGEDAVGDPTETALLEAAAAHGFVKKELEVLLPRIDEAPFESDRRRMSTKHRVDALPEGALSSLERSAASKLGLRPGGVMVFAKGAAESILEVSDRTLIGGRPVDLDDGLRARLREAGDRLAADGYRTLAFAMRKGDETCEADDDASSTHRMEECLEHNLVFVGFAGLIDPPRDEARGAVQRAVAAGVRSVMITGDHPRTAVAIARELDMAVEDDDVLTGRDLQSIGEDELPDVAVRTSVYARVSPADKLDIVSAYQARGHIVAMTGDGVNDAPALRRADIGIAMGRTGTDVSRGASDMVLMDDDFATIVAAVEEGRVIYDNIRKFLRYLLTANTGEIAVMVVALAAGLPLPLLPLQILWMNLITDGFPALALAVEPAERSIMDRPPRDPKSRLLDRRLVTGILSVGLFVGLVSLLLGYLYLREERAAWQTIVFTTITFSQIGLALGLRFEAESLFSRPGGNRYIYGAVVLAVVLHLGVVYVPFLQPVFDTVALSAGEMMAVIAVSSLGFWAAELEKLVIRRRDGM